MQRLILICQSSPDKADNEALKTEEVEDASDLKSKRIKRCKVEILENVQDEDLQTEMSSKSAICTHPGSFGDMCIVCGQKLKEESGVTFAYTHKGLRLEKDEINQLCNTDMKNLLCQRKLYLVLDLDHTLLNTTLLIHMMPEEEYLKAQTDSLQDIPKGSFSCWSI